MIPKITLDVAIAAALLMKEEVSFGGGGGALHIFCTGETDMA